MTIIDREGSEFLGVRDPDEGPKIVIKAQEGVEYFGTGSSFDMRQRELKRGHRQGWDAAIAELAASITAKDREIERLSCDVAQRDATITCLRDALAEHATDPPTAPYLPDLMQQIADQLPEGE